MSHETPVGEERLPGPRKVPATQKSSQRIGTNSATPVSGAGDDAFAEDFRGRVWRERKSPGACCAATSEVPRVARQSGLQVGIWGYPAGSRKEDARWDGGGCSARIPGRAAMNLERLRKRVRQYLDQVGDPTEGARATGFASYPLPVRVTVIRVLALHGPSEPGLSFQGKGPEGRDPVPQPSLQPGGALKMKAT